MPLVSLDDINVFLPQDKIEALDADDDNSALDAERIVKATLSGTFSPTVLASWATPATTPETIRAIAGRLTAALFYSRSLSEEQTEVNEYAQKLYNEAMSMLESIKQGFITLPEVDDEDQPTTGGSLDTTDFFPNATTPGPVFTMGQTW